MHSTFPLKLDKALIVYDIESTGINRKADRIIDLCALKLFPDGESKIYNFRVNPQMPIPPESSLIHGITDEDVKNSPPFIEIAHEIKELFEGCDLAGFNILQFDIPILQEEFIRAGMTFSVKGVRILDAQKIYHKKEPRTLSAALKFYCGEAHETAHNAESDVQATYEVIKAQLTHYGDLPQNMDELHKFCTYKDPSWVDQAGRLKWQGDEIVINFGKKQGQVVRELRLTDPGFLNWILKNDFPPDTKDIVKDLLNGGSPKNWVSQQ